MNMAKVFVKITQKKKKKKDSVSHVDYLSS